jgi:hypothetical protein
MTVRGYTSTSGIEVTNVFHKTPLNNCILISKMNFLKILK